MEKQMIQSKRRALATTFGTSVCLFMLAACQKEPKAEAPEASAASAAEGSGPCASFTAKLCGRTGDNSALCNQGKALANVLPDSACLAAVKDFAQMEQKVDADRKLCTDLMERLCKDVGPETDACKMVRDKTPQFPTAQCEELTKNYAQVLQEIKQTEAQNQPLAADAQARIAAKGAPSFGPDDAKVTIVEFSDFQCPYCTRAAAVTEQIKKQYGDKVRFVFRQFPLPMHPQAHLAAQASLVAHQQGKFWEYHDLLFANQNALSREALEGYAKQVGMNVPELQRALDAQTQKAAVDADMSLGEGVSVSGTPTLFINGKRVGNPTDFAPVAKMIDEALGV
jgi:protein-disulfide isomerase